MTRWESYSLPFGVELSAKLRDFLRGRRPERESRPEGEPITLRQRRR